MTLRGLLVKLRALRSPRQTDAELDEELRYHLERETERNVARGMEARAARDAARRAFGNPTVTREAARDAWTVAWLEQTAQDVRYALRGFRRAPLFVATVLLTIGVGLGVVTTVFTIFNTYFLRRLPVREPAALYMYNWSTRGGRGHRFSWNEYRTVARDNPAFASTVAMSALIARFAGAPTTMQAVTSNYFDVLGVPAAIGRTFAPDDDAPPAGDAVMVLSYRFWQSRFGGDSAVIGRWAALRGKSVRVVGVAQRGFEGTEDVPTDVWVPIAMLGALTDLPSVFDASEPRVLSLLGRLRPGLDERAARQLLGPYFAGLTAAAPDSARATRVGLDSRATPESTSPQEMALLAPIMALFVLVLVIACANVANIMLARATARQREIGVRLALGAGRARLVRQLLTEAVLLALPAGVIAFGLSRLVVDGGVRLMFASLPAAFAPYVRVLPLAPDARVFLFLLGAALATTLVFGLVPALQATRPNVVAATRGDFDTSFRPMRVRNALVAAQIAGCALLLVTGGVMLSGAAQMQRVDLGWRTDSLVQFVVRDEARERVIARLAADARVAAVAAALHEPLDGRFPSTTIGVPDDPAVVTRDASFNLVSPGYFDLLRVPVLRGRGFTEDEARASARVAVITESTARAMWPRGDAVGRELDVRAAGCGGGFSAPAAVRCARAESSRSSRAAVRVVGVIPDLVAGCVCVSASYPLVFMPTPRNRPRLALVARVRGDADAVLRDVAADLERLEPGAVDEAHSVAQATAVQTYPFRAAHWVSSALGAIALVLTVTGIYGVIAYLVAQRRKELGIRIALGATSSAIVSLVLRESMRVAGASAAVGVALAAMVSRVLGTKLDFLNLFDPMAYVGGLAVCLAACAVAAFVPARAATEIDPTRALRSD